MEEDGAIKEDTTVTKATTTEDTIQTEAGEVDGAEEEETLTEIFSNQSSSVDNNYLLL